jgi:hypothetical protein
MSRATKRLLVGAVIVVCGIGLAVWGSYVPEDQRRAVGEVSGKILRLLFVIAIAAEGIRIFRRKSKKKHDP